MDPTDIKSVHILIIEINNTGYTNEQEWHQKMVALIRR